jgi:hypothetical protein
MKAFWIGTGRSGCVIIAPSFEEACKKVGGTYYTIARGQMRNRIRFTQDVETSTYEYQFHLPLELRTFRKDWMSIQELQEGYYIMCAPNFLFNLERPLS